MQITFDTDNLTDADRELIATAAGINFEAGDKPTPPPAKKTAAKKAATPAKKAEPEPEPEEDLLGTGGPTKADAVKRATELVEAGDTATVRAALKDLGAKRVTDLTDDQVEAFLEAVAS